MSLTFEQQLTMMLVDKLAIGVIILTIVFLGQRMLEAYKGRQALWTEISKERVKHIANEWQEMNKWDCLVGELFYHLHLILLRHLPQAPNVDAQASTGPMTLAQTAKFLTAWSGQDIPAELRSLCETELRPLIDKSIEQSKTVNAALQDNRFWIGKELFEHCEKFRSILHEICVAFDAKKFEELATQAQQLDGYRQDVLTTLKLIK